MTERERWDHLAVRILHQPGCGNIVAVGQPKTVHVAGRSAKIVDLDIHAASGKVLSLAHGEFVRCPRCNEVVLIDGAVRKRAARAVSEVIWNHPTLGPVTKEDGARVGSLRVPLSE